MKIGFGTWSWGNQLLWGYDPKKDDTILRETFKIAIKGGLNLIDTADSYGNFSLNGRSEYLLGSFLKDLAPKQIKQLTIATKLAPYPWRIGRGGFNKAFEASKTRLDGKIDRIQIHWSTYRYAPWQEIPLIDCLGDLVENEQVQEIGLSNFGPKRLQWIHKRLSLRGIKIKSLQVQFSLISPQRNIYKKIEEICKDLEIDLLAYSPLALGVLAISPNAEIQPSTALRQRLFKNLLPKSLKLRKGLNDLANGRRVSQASIALNWCRAHGTIPIPGIRTPIQAKEATNALKWDLSQDECRYLDKLSEESIARTPNNPFQSE